MILLYIFFIFLLLITFLDLYINNSPKSNLVLVPLNYKLRNKDNNVEVVIDLKIINKSKYKETMVSNLDLELDFFKSKNINQFMIGRQFSRDTFFLERLKLEEIENKTPLIMNSIKDLDNYKYLNINLLKKSLFTALNSMSNSKKIKKDLSIIDNT